MRRILAQSAVAVMLTACGNGGKSLFPGAQSFDPVTGSELAADDDLAATTTAFFDQTVDHFGQGSAATFQQRYFVNDSQASGDAAPVFLYICGEGGCSANSMNVSLKAFAERYHGHMLALEHRYYGKSFPVTDLSTGNMVYLSAQQAIEDLATFIKAMQTTRHLTGPWLTVGGSYPGSLSAYMRALHPELVAGALASSAPVQPKLNFFEYDEHVATALPADCAAAVRSLVQQLEARSGSVAGPLGSALGYDDTTDSATIALVLGDYAAPVAQYDYRKAEFCQAVQSSNPAPGLAQFTQEYSRDFASFSSESSSTQLPDEKTVGGRMWQWQTCTEFGYFQTFTPNRSKGVFSRFDDLARYTNACQRLFGLADGPDTDKAARQYFAPLATATRILYTNGSNDPWSALSLNTETDASRQREVYAAVVDGGSHCSDLRAPKSTDSPTLAAAKTRALDLFGQWIGGAAGPSTGGAQPPVTTTSVGPTATATGVSTVTPQPAGVLSADLYLALATEGDTVTVYASGSPSVQSVTLCVGPQATCVASQVASLGFAAQTPSTSQLLGRSLFVSTAPLQLAAGGQVTLLGYDANGQLTAVRPVQFTAR